MNWSLSELVLFNPSEYLWRDTCGGRPVCRNSRWSFYSAKLCSPGGPPVAVPCHGVCWAAAAGSAGETTAAAEAAAAGEKPSHKEKHTNIGFVWGCTSGSFKVGKLKVKFNDKIFKHSEVLCYLVNIATCCLKSNRSFCHCHEFLLLFPLFGTIILIFTLGQVPETKQEAGQFIANSQAIMSIPHTLKMMNNGELM